MCLQKERGLRHQKLVEAAQKNHRKAVQFLKASLGRYSCSLLSAALLLPLPSPPPPPTQGRPEKVDQLPSL